MKFDCTAATAQPESEHARVLAGESRRSGRDAADDEPVRRAVSACLFASSLLRLLSFFSAPLHTHLTLALRRLASMDAAVDKWHQQEQAWASRLREQSNPLLSSSSIPARGAGGGAGAGGSDGAGGRGAGGRDDGAGAGVSLRSSYVACGTQLAYAGMVFLWHVRY